MMKLKVQLSITRVLLAVAIMAALCASSATAVLADTDTTPPKAYFPTGGGAAKGPYPVTATIMWGIYATDDVGVVHADVYLDGQKLTLPAVGMSMTTSGTPSGTSFLLNWDTTQVANGTHKLQLEVYDAASNSAWAMADADDYITYIVSNTAPATDVVSSTGSQDLSTSKTPSLCKVSQDEIDRLTQGIADRKSTRLKTMNNIETQLEKYYVSNHGKSQSYDLDLSEVYQAKLRAESAVSDLQQNDAIDCTNTPAVQLADFKALVSTATGAIDAYQDSLHQLIETIDEAIK